MEELKPCPFCGGEAKVYGGGVFVIPEIDENGAYVGASDYGTTPALVECQVCHASSNSFDDEFAIESAIEAWNRRVESHEH